jgi:septal ring factor EnvC (AmiA/AmiB activator)
MSLRSKLKQKETVEEENERLKAEMHELRALAQERDKKKSKYKAEAIEARTQVEALQKENKALKEEIGELIFGAGVNKGKGKGQSR